MKSPDARVAGRNTTWLVYTIWGTLIWVLGLSPAARALTYQRTFGIDYQQGMAASVANEGGIAGWLELASGVFVLGLGGASIVLVLASRRAELPKAGLVLWLGAMAWAAGSLLSARLGLHPDLSLTLLGVPVVFTAVYLLPPMPLSWFVKQARNILLIVYAYGSLLAALVAPGWAVEYPYTEGVIPGFDVRLHGLTSHANFLAPLLLTCIILNWVNPSNARWERLHQAVVLLALILAQSKTAWILFVLAYLIRLAYAQTIRNLPRLQRYLMFAFLGGVFSGGILYLATGPTWLDSVQVFFSSNEYTTLTGRTLVWQITLDLWEKSPWFGYGPGLWNLQMGRAYAPILGFVPAHAHNQVIQSLGESGILGVTGLFMYLVTLLAYGTRYARVTSGVALALVSAMLLRGISEPSFRGGVGDSNFYIHFVTFTFLVLSTRRGSMPDEEPKVTHGARQPLSASTRSGPPGIERAGRTRV